jgi:hypothetical protein
VFVAATSLTTLSDEQAFSIFQKLFQYKLVFAVFHDSSWRDEDDCIFSAATGFKSPFSVIASSSLPVAVTNDICQRSQVAINSNDDASAVAAVTSIRSTARDVCLSAEAHATVSAVSGLT